MPELFSGLLVNSWWKSSSGLILPCTVRDRIPTHSPSQQPRFRGLLWAERSNPLPNMAAYATPEALNVEPLPFEAFCEMLAGVPRDALLPILSNLQARLFALEHDEEKELQLGELIFGKGQAMKLLRAFVINGEGRRTVFSEQGLALLQWLSIAFCSDEEVEEIGPELVAAVPRTILGVMSYLEVAGAELQDEQRHERWLRHLTQNFAFNSSPVVGNAVARTWTIFGRLHRSATDIRPEAEIDDWFLEDYGLSLELQMVLSFALYGTLSAAEDSQDFVTTVKQAELDGIFDFLSLSEAERSSAMAMIAAPLSHFREEIEGKTLDQATWEQVSFMRHPLIEVRPGLYLLQSPRALIGWMVDGPYYRALDSAHKRGERAVKAFTARVGRLMERYVLELVESVHPEPRLPVTGKVYGDKTYGSGSHSSDVSIIYPHEAVLIEVSSHRLSLLAKRDGDFDALRHDLTEMVGRRPKQLRRCIEAMKPRESWRAKTLRFPHLDPEHLARIWPISVTATPVQWTPLLEEFLGADLQELESRPDVAPLEVLAVEDLESLLAVFEETGRPLPALLARKSAVMGSRADYRSWIARDREVPSLAQPRYLDTAFDEFMAVAARLLGVESFDEDDGSASVA
ncbi:MAG TPA: hypothetical protein VHR18_10865 [Solirubrobacterales bacterium]|jgi:hypothetical protein|nr:hypothetical protein [Solirubrobacterales bacterium]